MFLSVLSSKRLKYISQGFTIVEVSIGCLKHSEKKSFVLKFSILICFEKLRGFIPFENLPSKNDELEAMRVRIRMRVLGPRDCKVNSIVLKLYLTLICSQWREGLKD